MKRIAFILFFALGALGALGQTATKPVIIEGLADPCVLKYNNKYYLYGTSDGASSGFKVYVSDDLKTWSSAAGVTDGYALHKNDVWGTKGFWAPEVVYQNNKFYMLYCADHHIALATSNSPLGPFTQTDKKPLHPATNEIDPALLFDDNGKAYLYFVRFDHANQIYGAEINSDLASLKTEPVKVITATEPWEHTANNPNMKWPVTEAPYVMKHKGYYYLFYTANHFKNPDYALGYAISKSPLGPFEKYSGNPILMGSDSFKGTGTNSIVLGPNNQYYIFYHAHFSPEKVSPRKTLISPMEFIKQGKGKPDAVKIN
ncbi:MAG: beta-xylosidase [Sphingobacteriaceae bacterium]|jgi:beta-xylosidase|nr:beta-xylosidase [Sphingobacteriaceae bacterium]